MNDYDFFIFLSFFSQIDKGFKTIFQQNFNLRLCSGAVRDKETFCHVMLDFLRYRHILSGNVRFWQVMSGNVRFCQEMSDFVR